MPFLVLVMPRSSTAFTAYHWWERMTEGKDELSRSLLLPYKSNVRTRHYQLPSHSSRQVICACITHPDTKLHYSSVGHRAALWHREHWSGIDLFGGNVTCLGWLTYQRRSYAALFIQKLHANIPPYNFVSVIADVATIVQPKEMHLFTDG